MDDYTRKFDFVIDQDAEIHRIMLTVYQALEEKGYNPINQIVGYILSEDPTYITNHNQLLLHHCVCPHAAMFPAMMTMD